MLADLWGALWDYSVAIAKRPGAATLHVNRGMTYLERGSVEAALADLNTAIALDDSLVEGWAARSLAKVAAGDVVGARRDVREACRLGPTHPRAAEALHLVEQAENAPR